MGGNRGAGPMARNPATSVAPRDARLSAERRNQTLVDVRNGNALGAVAEEERDQLASPPVEEMGLRWSEPLPGDQGSSQERVDWLRERVPGLVGWDVKQADGILVRLAWLHLPANAAKAQPHDLVAAEPTEEPGKGEAADQLERVLLPYGDVLCREIDARPKQLGPEIVGDDA